MSNFNDQDINTVTSLPAARVSYTLGDSQPVLCTMIDHQPLFYTDHEDADADKYGEPFPVAETIEASSEEIEKLDQMSSQYTLSTDDYISTFQEARNSITGQGTYEEPATTIETLTQTLSQSRLAKAYLDEAEKYGTQLRFDTSVKSAIYDRENGTICINPYLSEDNQILVALNELRSHYQHRQGALLNPLHFNPENAILINRMQHADVISSTIRCAWELQLSGHKSVWKVIENSSYADLARAFTREAYLDFRTVNNGFATTAAFEAWFLSERCRHVDRTLIRQMLADHDGSVFNIDHEQASIQPAIISALGEMPFGNNYLAKYASTIMSDPIFSEVRDRSNANFLWFIKFERTFRETEHDLQSSFSSATSAEGNTGQDQTDEKVVVLFERTENQPTQQPIAANGGAIQGGNVIQLGAERTNREQ